MPFRPLREDEQAKILEKIDKEKKDIGLRQRYLWELEQEIKEGVWYMAPEEWEAMLERTSRIALEDAIKSSRNWKISTEELETEIRSFREWKPAGYDPEDYKTYLKWKTSLSEMPEEGVSDE